MNLYPLPQGPACGKHKSPIRLSSVAERLFLPLCLFLLCTIPISTAAAAGDRLDWEYELSRGHYPSLVEQLLPLVKKDAQARRLLAEVYRRLGKYEEALALLQKESGPGAVLRARILAEIGRLNEALRVLASCETSPAALVLAGRIHQTLGKRTEAVRLFREAVAYYQAMTYEDARSAPASLFAVFGRALMGLDRYEEANEIMLDQALQKDPDDLEVLLFAGDLFTTKYDFPEGRKYYRKALRAARRHPDVLARLARAILDDPMLGGTRLSQAASLASEAVKTNPRHEAAHLVLGDVAFFDGLYNEAEKHYSTAADTNPTSFEALGGIYACAVLTFKNKEAQQAEAKARAVNPNPAPFYVAAAKRCELQNQYPVVLSLAEEAYRCDPAYWPLYTPLALAELRSGRYESARRYVQEGFKRDPYNVWLANTKKLLKYWDAEYTVVKWEKLIFHVPKKAEVYYVTYLGPLLVRARREFSERYAFSPEGEIHVELYPRQEYFACRTIGLPDFPAQGVCFGPVIAVTVPPAYPGNYAVAAWHEFAHVFTVVGSGYRIPRWLTEGISVREEGLCPVGGVRPFASALGRAVASGDLPGPADFDHRFRRPKDPQEILSAYALCPLAVDLFIKQWGRKALARLLPMLRTTPFDVAFKKVTGSDLKDFDKRFKDHLRTFGAPYARQFAGSGADVQKLRELVRQGKASQRDQADLAWALLARGRTVDAETLALKLRTTKAYQGEGEALVGLIAYQDGRLRKAEEHLRAALRSGTRNEFRVLATLAQIARRHKQVEAEIKFLKQACEKFPELSAEGGDNGLMGRLCRLLSENNDAQVERFLKDLVARNRDAIWARFALADIYHKQGKDEEELHLLKQLVYVAPFRRGGLNTKLFERLAQCADKAGYPVEAARARKVLGASKQ